MKPNLELLLKKEKEELRLKNLIQSKYEQLQKTPNHDIASLAYLRSDIEQLCLAYRETVGKPYQIVQVVG